MQLDFLRKVGIKRVFVTLSLQQKDVPKIYLLYLYNVSFKWNKTQNVSLHKESKNTLSLTLQIWTNFVICWTMIEAQVRKRYRTNNFCLSPVFPFSTVMFLSFLTDMPGQTVQTEIRLLLIRVYTVCHSVCIVWTLYSTVEPHSSNFRVITTNFLGVQIFRKFTVFV